MIRVVAMVGGPELAGRVLVPRVDQHARAPAVEPRAAQRVVELVHGEDRPDAGCVEPVELAVDLGRVALRRAVELPAVEHLGHLDPEHDGELAVVDDSARLGRAADQPEEALPGAAELSVDVVLQRAHVGGLLVGADHLVAVVLLVRIELAEGTVLDQVVDHQPQPAPPGALDPLPVGALVSLRLVARPAGEARPALRAVGAVRAARAEEVLGHRACPVGEVVGAVLQRGRDAVGAPRPAAMEAPAEEVEGAEVDVIVQESAHPGGRARAP